jgi:predicted amidohydrolase
MNIQYFKLIFGKVGLMVCYDNHFPEVARILAVKGAELIAYSNMGDGRVSQGGVWEPFIRTRAIDNHIAIVSAVNQGRSCIVNGGGEILAINKRSSEEPGACVQASVDLNSSVINYSGRSIQKRYMLLRRPDT